jgi:hypothetical protein
MKSRITLALILIASLNAAFATIWTPLDFSKDNLDARLAVQNRTFLKSMQVEYDAILSSRICLLKYDGVRRCFGRSLVKTPDDCALPLFAENGSARGGYSTSPDKSHIDFNTIGDLGYVEIFYNSDGESIGDAAIYFRTDEHFVPLQSTNDYDKRLSWEMTKFDAVKEWLDQHLPKVKDLGTVEVTNTPPDSISHGGGNRLDLGGGKICIIQFYALADTPVFLKAHPQYTTNDCSVCLYLAPTNSDGQLKDIHSYRSPRALKSVIFVVDDQFYRLTLIHK